MDSSVNTQSKKVLARGEYSENCISGFLDIDKTDISVTEIENNFSHLGSSVSLDKLPQISAILNSTESEDFDIDDLDLLQLELEALLSAVAVRSRILQKEINTSSCAENKRKEHFEDALSTVKQPDTQNKFKKKVKEVSSRPREKTAEVPALVKSTQVKRSSDIAFDEPGFKPPEKLPQSSQRKYEPPNKFWLSLNPFCTDISYQDIKFLEELIEKYESNQDILKIPLLGRHYSERWAEEELINEQCESHFAGKNKAKQSVASGESDVLLRRADNSIRGPTAIPLTERVISALLEESIEVPENYRKITDNFSGGNKTHKSDLAATKSGLSSLERRIQKALEQEGLLDSKYPHSCSVDEILQELRNCQTEMEVINNFNVTNLRRLLKLARKEVLHQDLRRKLEMADNEVFENYKTLLVAKQKRMPLSKTLQDQCWNSLKQRDKLKRQLDSLPDDG